MCSALPSVTNGEIFYSTDITAPHDYGTDSRTECDPGFGLRVGGTRSCYGDGSSATGYWLGTPSICDRTFDIYTTKSTIEHYSFEIVIKLYTYTRTINIRSKTISACL